MAAKPGRKVARPHRGRTSPGDVHKRHARILDAATAVFLERGFSGATVTEIARRAGCSLETLYSEYPTKARMFAALITRRAKGIFEAVGPLSPERDPQEALSRFANEVLALMTRPDVKSLHRLVIAEAQDFPELGLNFWTEGTGSGLESLKEFFEGKKAAGEMAVNDAQRASEVFVALVLGMVSMRSIVGLSTVAGSRKEQMAWAEYSVGLFMTLLDAKVL